MLNRRTLLTAGLALPGSLLASRLVAGVAAGDPLAHPVQRVVIDRRHAASRAFGLALARRGAVPLEYDGDLAALWTADLAPAWATRPVAVAGMTTPAALICLERLALARRLRVVWRAPDPDADPAWRMTAAAAATTPLLRWMIAPA